MITEKILVFKTDLSRTADLLVAQWLLDPFPGVLRWSLDQEDCDNVLRVVGSANLNEDNIISLIKAVGYECKTLL